MATRMQIRVSKPAQAKWNSLDSIDRAMLVKRAMKTEPPVYSSTIAAYDYPIQVDAEVKPDNLTLFGATLSKVLSSKVNELSYCSQWAALKSKELGPYTLEKQCAAGRMDVYFSSSQIVVEAKFSSNWKSALGQVIAYRYCCTKTHTGALLLIDGRDSNTDRHFIEEVCNSADIAVFWLNV